MNFCGIWIPEEIMRYMLLYLDIPYTIGVNKALNTMEQELLDERMKALYKRYNTLCSAYRQGDYKATLLMLKNISTQSKTVLQSCDEGRRMFVDMMDRDLSSLTISMYNKNIAHWSLNEIAEYCCRIGSISTLRLAIDNGANSYVDILLASCSSPNWRECMDVVIDKVSPSDIEEVLIWKIGIRDQSPLLYLLSKRPNNINYLVLHATRKGSLNIVKYILSNYTLTIHRKIKRTAYWSNHEHIVEYMESTFAI